MGFSSTCLLKRFTELKPVAGDANAEVVDVDEEPFCIAAGLACVGFGMSPRFIVEEADLSRLAGLGGTVVLGVDSAAVDADFSGRGSTCG